MKVKEKAAFFAINAGNVNAEDTGMQVRCLLREAWHGSVARYFRNTR